jgi:hypothetical protein
MARTLSQSDDELFAKIQDMENGLDLLRTQNPASGWGETARCEEHFGGIVGEESVLSDQAENGAQIPAEMIDDTEEQEDHFQPGDEDARVMKCRWHRDHRVQCREKASPGKFFFTVNWR